MKGNLPDRHLPVAPHPSIDPTEQLVSHTEEVVIAQPMPVVSAVMNKPLEKTILKSNSLPGVSGDYMLTKGPYGEVGLPTHR